MCALIFQRAQEEPSFATEAELKTLAAWTPLLTASDDTKVQITPEFSGLTLPGSEPQFAEQNTNNSIDGNGYFTGYNSVQPKGNFTGLPSAIRKQLAAYEDESRPGLDPGLTAFILLNDGRLVYDYKDEVISGIPLTNFYMASLNTEGFKSLNQNAFGFSLDGQWDTDIQVATPTFRARQALRL
jgi:hypothetical protein